MRTTPGLHRSSATFCRAHRAHRAQPTVRRSAVALPVERVELEYPRFRARRRRGRMVLGGVASWALLTAGTMLLLSALTT